MQPLLVLTAARQQCLAHLVAGPSETSGLGGPVHTLGSCLVRIDSSSYCCLPPSLRSAVACHLGACCRQRMKESCCCPGVTNLRFAGDVLSFATTQEQQQKMMCEFKHSTEKVGLKIHPGKTKILSTQSSIRRREMEIYQSTWKY